MWLRGLNVKVLFFTFNLFKYHLFTFKYTHPILFKAQEYLYLTIFEKPMIKVHDSSPWQNNFINRIQIHNQSPWFKPMAIHSSKTQFSLATSMPNSYWQYQNPILIGNSKSQFSLATSKPNFHWHYFIKKKRAQDYQRSAKKKILC